jgi:hypothetical protein
MIMPSWRLAGARGGLTAKGQRLPPEPGWAALVGPAAKRLLDEPLGRLALALRILSVGAARSTIATAGS